MRTVTQQRRQRHHEGAGKVYGLAGLIVAFGMLAAPLGSSAQRPLGYAVNARINVETGEVTGAWVAQVQVEQGQSSIRLWLYPDRLAVVPDAMTEVSGRWIFPGEVSLGGLSVQDVRVDGIAAQNHVDREPVGARRGRDVAGADLVIPIANQGSRVVEVRLRFSLQLAQRFGRLSWVGRRILLGAPWYPLVIDEHGGWRHAVEHNLWVERADGGAVLAGNSFGEREARTLASGDFVPVYASDDLRLQRLHVEGVDLSLVHGADEYRSPGAEAQGLARLNDLARVDRLSRIEERVRDAAISWRLAEVESGVPPRLTIVMSPLRTELCASAPGWVLLSDRAYQLSPMESLRAMHDAALRRAVFRTWASTLSADRDEPVDRTWADDLRAVVLVDLDRARRQGANRTTEDILGWAGFHPSVDNLLYAPQVSFVDVLFGSIHEPDPFRDSPDRARAPLARGRALLGAIRDELEPESLEEFGARILRGTESARRVLATSSHRFGGGSAESRLAAWLSVSEAEVNYELGELDEQEVGAGEYRLRVPILRQGTPREDPVEIVVHDQAGGEHRAIWSGQGDTGEVAFSLPVPVERVRLDPRGRLRQSPEVADGHPLRDDTNRLPWRPPLLQQIDLATNPIDGSVRASLDFVMRRRYDLERGFGLLLSTNERGTGGYARYIMGVGPKRTTNARVGVVSTGVFLTRLSDGFEGQREGAWRGGASVAGGINTQRYGLDPRNGLLLFGALRVALSRVDSGELRYTLNGSARATYTTHRGLRQAFVLVADTSWVWGDPLASERPALGGPFLMRSMLPGSVLGDGRVLGVAEYRFSALQDLQWNMVQFGWVRELQLIGFGGVGASFTHAEWSQPEWAAELGLGARLHVEWGGFLPGLIAIDMAMPLRDIHRDTPVNMRIGFSQFF